MYCTSVGKVILSQMTDEEVEEILSREKKAFTDYTITDQEKLWEEVRNARRDGYACLLYTSWQPVCVPGPSIWLR